MGLRKIRSAWLDHKWNVSRAIQKPGAERRRLLLEETVTAARAKERGERNWGGIVLHCEGGRGFGHDLRRLVNEGYLKMISVPYHKGWGGNYNLTRSVLIPTPKAFEEIEK